MTKLSSDMTFFNKKVLPAILLGMVPLTAGILVAAGVSGAALFAGAPFLLVVWFIVRKFVSDLADEVYDGGDYLLIRNDGREHRLPLADVTNVSGSLFTNPPRITLRIANAGGAGPLGSEVTFSPKRPFSLNPFAKNPIFEDLLVRVDRARARRAG